MIPVTNNLNIIVAGPRGKMGSETVRMIEEVDHFQLVGAVDSKNNGRHIRDIEHLPNLDAVIYDDLQTCINQTNAHVLIDFTTPDAGKEHMRIAMENQIYPVIGTSGFSEEEVTQLDELAKTNHVGAIIAPSFAVGAVLMMKFSQMAAKYFPDVEIIEQHHDQKLDAPSGTAVKTAEMIQKTRATKQQGHSYEKETIQGARGATVDGMHIHSVRLPGLVAHQEVMFGGNSEIFKIRHDSMHRKSFMTGVQLAVEKVIEHEGLIYGLDNILE